MPGIEPRGIAGYYPEVARQGGVELLGDDFSGWGRFEEITAGNREFKTICECRLEQRWSGRHANQMPDRPTALEFLRGMQRMQGTDAPFSNSVFLRCDNPDISVTAQVSYGSGAGIDEFFCSVGAGTSLQVPGTYWRVSMRVDQIAIGDAAAYPPTGTKVVVGALVGRGSGANNTRPHLDQYWRAAAATPVRVKVPTRADSFKMHLAPPIDAAMSVDVVGLGSSILARYAGPLTQDAEYQLWSGAKQLVITPGAAATSGVIRFWLVLPGLSQSHELRGAAPADRFRTWAREA